MTLHRITYDPIERIELDASIALPDDINATRAKLNQLGTDIQTQFNGLSVDFNELNEQATNPVDGFAKQIQDLDNATVQMAGNITSLDNRVTALEAGGGSGGASSTYIYKWTNFFPANITGAMLGRPNDTTVFYTGLATDLYFAVQLGVPVGDPTSDAKQNIVTTIPLSVYPPYTAVEGAGTPPSKQCRVGAAPSIWGKPIGSLNRILARVYNSMYDADKQTTVWTGQQTIAFTQTSATDYEVRFPVVVPGDDDAYYMLANSLTLTPNE